MSNPIIEIEDGKLRGLVSKVENGFTYYTFKGIPYAKPPVGELRFAAPQPPQPWDDIRDATINCNTSPQFDRMTNKVVGDEDCLYLNVYTPKLPLDNSSALPVMVFIHGGGFVFGSGTDASLHGPDYLIQKDIVLVTFNYRLGALGFLTLNRKEATGNMGLKDQVQALKWVQKNIAKFGGDPNNVTIFGISAGGASVEYLLLSPTAKGLFHKSIMQSGSSLCNWAQNDRNKIKACAYKISKLAGKDITDDDKLLEYLKSLPVQELINLSMTVIFTEKFKGGINFSFVPCLEEEGDWEPFLSKNTYKTLSNGAFSKVPVMTGYCQREGLLMIFHGPQIYEKVAKDQKFVERLPFNISSGEQSEMEARLKNIYIEGDKHSDEDYYAIDYFTDVDFLGGIYVAATSMAKHTPVYLYEFSYDGGLNFLKKTVGLHRAGAAHADDGAYILKCNLFKHELNDTDILVQNRMLSLWTNFARYGNPTPDTDKSIPEKWKPMNETGANCFVIDKTLSTKKVVYPRRMELYEELYKKENENQ